MRSDFLHVVAVYANPLRWGSRRSVHDAFERHMLDSGVKLTTVECAYGERPFELPDHPDINRVRVRANSMVWNKECLQKIGINRLPDSAKYIGTFDADIRFRKPGWAAESVHALQHYQVIQPWTNCYDLGPNDEHLEVHWSFLREWFHGNPMTQGIDAKQSPYRFGHCGYAWCWRRDALERVGNLIDTAPLGAADHHMALSLIGKAWSSLPGFISHSYQRYIYQWEKRAVQHINFSLGYLPWTIEHAWHGRKALRAYVARWDILKKHKFDPDTDLKWNTWGVVELAGNKPGLSHDIDLYFRSRLEDANTID